MNPLVEAAWIAIGGVLLGVGGTVIVGVSGFRSTRNATERTVQAAQEDRLWHKKADTYADALAATSARDKWLGELMGTVRKVHDDAGGMAFMEQLPERLPGQSEQEWLNLQGRLRAYGAAEVLHTYNRAYDMTHTAVASYRFWREAVTDGLPLLAGPLGDEPGVANQTKQAMSSAWRELIDACRNSRDADSALDAAVRLDLKVDLPPPSPVNAWTGPLSDSRSSAQPTTTSTAIPSGIGPEPL